MNEKKMPSLEEIWRQINKESKEDKPEYTGLMNGDIKSVMDNRNSDGFCDNGFLPVALLLLATFSLNSGRPAGEAYYGGKAEAYRDVLNFILTGGANGNKK